MFDLEKYNVYLDRFLGIELTEKEVFYGSSALDEEFFTKVKKDLDKKSKSSIIIHSIWMAIVLLILMKIGSASHELGSFLVFIMFVGLCITGYVVLKYPIHIRMMLKHFSKDDFVWFPAWVYNLPLEKSAIDFQLCTAHSMTHGIEFNSKVDFDKKKLLDATNIKCIVFVIKQDYYIVIKEE